MILPTRHLPLVLLLAAGCARDLAKPGGAVDAYGAWLNQPPQEPVPSYFRITQVDHRFWFIAPSGRRFLAVSGATTPASGIPVNAGQGAPMPYFTAGLADEPGGRPIPKAAPGLPDPWDESTLPGLTDAALPPAVYGDDPFCLGHLVIPATDLNRLPDALEQRTPPSPAAAQWFTMRTRGGTPGIFRDEFAERLYAMMSAALRGADENHLVFTGWLVPGVTPTAIAKSLGRWGDAVCVRLPATSDAGPMAHDAYTMTGKPLLIWLSGPDAPLDPALRSVALDLLKLPFVIGVDSPLPPSAEDSYRRHSGR